MNRLHALLTACAAAVVLALLQPLPADASLASIGYTVLRWLDRADIVHHRIVARIDPPEWVAEFSDDVTFASRGSRRFHVLLGKDARLDRIIDPESGASVAFHRSITLGALPFHIYRIELPTAPAGEMFTLRFEWTIDASTVSFLNPFVARHFFYIGYASIWYPHMPEERFFTGDVTILAPQGYQAFAEGVAEAAASQDVESGAEGWVAHRFRTEAPVNGMGLGVGYYRNDTVVASEPYRVEVWRPQGLPATAPQVGLATARALRYLDKRLGAPPASAFRVVEVPFASATSYASLSNLVYGGNLSHVGIDGRDGLTLFAAHETAHKWLGGTVGVRLIGGAWLSEGLAEYLGYLALAGIEGSDDALRLFESRTYLPFAKRAGESNRALSAIEMFDVDAQWMYVKSPLVFRMLHRRLGTERFFAVTRSFLDAHRERHVTGRDFENWVRNHAQGMTPSANGAPSGDWGEPLFAEGAGGNLPSFFNTWVRSGGRLDYALGVDVSEAPMPGSDVAVTISVTSVGAVVEPGGVDVALNFPDGHVEWVVLSPGESRTLRFALAPDEVRLDPDRWLADANPSNNLWRRGE